MRMSVLRYFLVVGLVLFGLLMLVNSKTESSGPAVKTAQTVGLPQSVRLQPEPPPQVTAVNFAAEQEPPQLKPIEPVNAPKAVEKKRKEKTASKHRQTWHRYVQYPFSPFSIR
jgi:hypothetical protein